MLPVFGLPGDFEIMNADTESSVDVARSRAEKLVNEGANVLVGAFDSGQSAAIAQVAEQKGVPYVINIAAAPQITGPETGRASCRERVCQYGSISVLARPFNKKHKK